MPVNASRHEGKFFLAETEQVVPWGALLAIIELIHPKAGKGRCSYPVKTMLRTYLLQNRFDYDDPAMERHCAKWRHYAALPDRR